MRNLGKGDELEALWHCRICAVDGAVEYGASSGGKSALKSVWSAERSGVRDN